MIISQILVQASRFPLIDFYLHRLRQGIDLSWRAVVELLLIALVIYPILRFLEGTRGARLLQAVLVVLTAILALAIVSRILQLDRILVLYPYFVGGAFLITLVVFQPELRRGLMRIGESLSRRSLTAQSHKLIDSVVHATVNMSSRRHGALIAIERRIPVGGLRETGVSLDAEITHELLESVFWPGSALHDLGVIISHGRIAAARCQFPLAEVESCHRQIGSRHRAALGMSMESDAVVVVVSEETGTVSVAMRGILHRGLPPDQLREILATALLHASEDEEGLAEGSAETISAAAKEQPAEPVAKETAESLPVVNAEESKN